MAKLKEGMRSGSMVRHHPVARQLQPYLQLAGAFMIHQPSYDAWEIRLSTSSRLPGEQKVWMCTLPTSSTLDECRYALADLMGVAARG